MAQALSHSTEHRTYTTVTTVRLIEKVSLAGCRVATASSGRDITYVYRVAMSRQAVLTAAVKQLCTQFGTGEVERQYVRDPARWRVRA